VPGNARAPEGSPTGDGKCHREQTADGRPRADGTGKGEKVR